MRFVDSYEVKINDAYMYPPPTKGEEEDQGDNKVGGEGKFLRRVAVAGNQGILKMN